MGSIDDLFPKRGSRSRGCSICGEPNFAYVQIRIQSLAENGHVKPVKDGGKANSRARSLCATHATEVWPALVSVMERK